MPIQQQARQEKTPLMVQNENKKSGNTDPLKSEKHTKNKQEEVVVEVGPEMILGIIGVIVLIIAGIYFFRSASQPAVVQPTTLAESLVDAKAQVDSPYADGKADAPITIVEYSDYECPFCKYFATGINPSTGQVEPKSIHKQIKEEFVDKGEVRYIFRPFIAVPSHNPAAASEAVANFCAGDQGKFWEYRDAIFLQTRTSGLGIDGKGAQEDALIAAATTIGLDKTKFTNCYRARNMDQLGKDNSFVMGIIKPVFDVKKITIGTPLFVVCKTPTKGEAECSGRAFTGAESFENIKAIIELVKQ